VGAGEPPVFDDESHNLLVRGIAAAKANSREEARFFLDRALKADLSLEDRVQAWRYLADLSDDQAEKRSYFEKILAVDPADGTAQRDLAILNGVLDPDDIVDPERPIVVSEARRAAEGARFVCSRCGSNRLYFAPNGRFLECEHCHHTQPVEGSPRGPDVQERQFVATMWTPRGRHVPKATPSFTCHTCGACFVVAAGELSFACPYCGSTYAMDRVDSRDLLEPEAIVPFALAGRDAAERLETWGRDHGIDQISTPARGVFIPVWVLNFIGEIGWTGTAHDETIGPDVPERTSGTHTIIGRNVRVPGVESVSGPLDVLVDDFDLSGLRPYDPRLLAAWPAAAYEVSLEDAALLARSRAIAALRPEVLEKIGSGVHDVAMDFSRMAADSFTLALMPIWIAEGTRGDSRVTALVNGQSGTVRATIPRKGLSGWLEGLLS
jgi:DNA-directed RNA polymerase subunit RPC12/RpoP